jgi:hypothetical protein
LDGPVPTAFAQSAKPAGTMAAARERFAQALNRTRDWKANNRE